MTETCPHLRYRTEGDGKSFETARAFCAATESFVQPMRADICNARYGLDPARDCEFYVAPDGTLGSDETPKNDEATAEETTGDGE